MRKLKTYLKPAVSTQQLEEVSGLLVSTVISSHAAQPASHGLQAVAAPSTQPARSRSHAHGVGAAPRRVWNRHR